MLVLPERERMKKGVTGVEIRDATCQIPLELHNQVIEKTRETDGKPFTIAEIMAVISAFII